MKHLLIVFLIILPAVSIVGQFYKDYPDTLKVELAESYYLAGMEYKKLGHSQGDRYIKMAYEIYPALDAAIINEAENSIRTKDFRQSAAQNKNAPPLSAAEKKLLEYRFIRFIGVFFANNAETMGAFLDQKILTGESESAIIKADIVLRLESVSKDLRVSGFSATKLYDFKTINIDDVADSGIYELHIFPDNAMSGSLLGFKTGEHIFGFRKYENEYRLCYFNGLLTGDTGKVVESEEARLIRNAFGEALDSFFAEDIRSLSAHFGKEIVILPLGSTLTNEEAAITFSGFIGEDGLDTKGLESNAAFDSEASVVRYSNILSGKYGGKIYRLEPVMDTEYIDRMPFFAQYLEYYFALIDGNWVIVAVG
jgi:hypothetical protein